MPKLQDLKSIQEDPTTVKSAMFFVGWYLLTPHSWAYVDVFTGERDVVTLDALIKAVEAKKMRLASISKKL